MPALTARLGLRSRAPVQAMHLKPPAEPPAPMKFGMHEGMSLNVLCSEFEMLSQLFSL